MSDQHSGRDPAGKFVPGNQLWQLRTSHGPPRKFEGPDDLWPECLGYFKWCHDNPLYADELVKFQGEAKHVRVAKMRAMTITGLCLYLGISVETWYEWRKSRADLSETIRATESAIYTQKVEGAAADLLNASFIGKEIGLVDKSELSGKDGAPIEIEDKTERDPLDLARMMVFALNKAQHEQAEARKQRSEDEDAG